MAGQKGAKALGLKGGLLQDWGTNVYARWNEILYFSELELGHMLKIPDLHVSR